MAKKKVHYLASKLKSFSPWYFLAAALVFTAISVYGMRQNNLAMIKLRDGVFEADKSGGDTEAALRDLREHVHAHMNTNLASDIGIYPPIQLKHEYERLVEAEKKRTGTANEQIYTAAQKHCEALYPGSFSGGPRVPCIRDYVTKNTVKEQSIPDALYKFDFVSPNWSPDLAGWSLLGAVLFFAVFILKLGLDNWVKHDLKRQL